MRPFSVVFVPGLLSFALACDGEPAATAPCEEHRECQDGDLCNGAERCVGGTCEPGTPGLCPSVGPWSCETRCAEDERCEADVCEPVCLVPALPGLAVVPSSARLAIPSGLDLAVVAPGGETAPDIERATVEAGVLRFFGAGRVHLEAAWIEPGECSQTWSGFIDVVDTLG